MRRVCQECGRSTSRRTSRRSRDCSKCGGDVIQRADDYPDRFASASRPTSATPRPARLLRVAGCSSSSTATRAPTYTVAIQSVISIRASLRRSSEELNKMRKAGKVVAEMHEPHAPPSAGITTWSSTSRAQVLAKRGARSNFLNYNASPVICTSPNDMIVHGIPAATASRRATSSRSTAGHHRGYHGDAATPRRRRRQRRRAAVDGRHRTFPVAGLTSSHRERLNESVARCSTSPRRPGTRRARVRGTHWHRMHETPGAQLLAGSPADTEGGHGVRDRAHGQRRLLRHVRARRRWAS